MDVQDIKGIVLHIVGCLLIFYSGFMFGRATLPTETELERLDRNLTELRNINDRQRTESATLRKQLEVSQTQLTAAGKQSQMLREQLGALKLTLEGQEQSLQNANRLLRQYEQEERSRLRKIKSQRNIAYMIAAACLYFAVRKL